MSQAGFIGTPYGYARSLGYGAAIVSPYRAAVAPFSPVACLNCHSCDACLTTAAPVAVTRTIAPAAPVRIAKAAPVVAAAPAVVAKAAPAVTAPGVHATQYHAQDELRNYEFGYQNPNSARTEKGNAELGTVAGSYSYVDGHGLTQKVDYVADALGFRVTGSNGAATYSAGPAVVAAAPAIAAAPALGARLLHKRQAVTGLGYTIPTGHLATAAPVALSAQASRAAILETVKLNPGHAVAYRVY